MASFQKLWENIQAAKEKSPQDDRAMAAIRTGIGVREDFWDDFLLVINNSEGLSELLNVPTVKIAEWHDRVKHALDKVQKADGTPEPKDNGKLLKTGHSDELDPHTVVTNPLQ
jgi:hypothetical protein